MEDAAGAAAPAAAGPLLPRKVEPKRLVADLSLDVQVLKEVTKKASSVEHGGAGW